MGLFAGEAYGKGWRGEKYGDHEKGEEKKRDLRHRWVFKLLNGTIRGEKTSRDNIARNVEIKKVGWDEWIKWKKRQERRKIMTERKQWENLMLWRATRHEKLTTGDEKRIKLKWEHLTTKERKSWKQINRKGDTRLKEIKKVTQKEGTKNDVEMGKKVKIWTEYQFKREKVNKN